jgi:hypothetical protein
MNGFHQRFSLGYGGLSHNQAGIVKFTSEQGYVPVIAGEPEHMAPHHSTPAVHPPLG